MTDDGSRKPSAGRAGDDAGRVTAEEERRHQLKPATMRAV
jgi:hypothetical protein